ncbi:MAG: glycosyltransferase [Candidatus Binatia bacterium]
MHTESVDGSVSRATQSREEGRLELEEARAQLHHTRQVVAYLRAQVGETVRTLDAIEHHLRAVAKTKPYRLAHFLRRVERDFLKGARHDRRAFVAWLIQRLGGRQPPVDARKNPLLTLPVATGSVRDYQARLRAILQAHRNKPVIVSRPIVEWDLPLFQRPHHLARQLAAQGFLYFFCTPNWTRDRIDGFNEIGPGCYVTDQTLLLDTLTGRVTHLLSTDNACSLDYVRFRQSAGDVVLYEYIDHIHAAVSGRAIPDVTRTRHHALLADETIVCIATADQLLSEVKAVRGRNFALVTNGVDIEHFASGADRSQPPPDEIRAIVDRGRPIIGYFGAFASWFDYALVEHAARERPQYEWLLIGVDYDGSIDRSNLRRLRNVTLLGPIAYRVLPRYAAYFDIATIPFVRNEITLSTSPIKLFEYMALGKPIVTTDLPECRKYRSCLVARSHGEFLQLLDKALEMRTNPAYLTALRADAEANSWAGKARDIATLLRENLHTRTTSDWDAPGDTAAYPDPDSSHQSVANWSNGDTTEGAPVAVPSVSQPEGSATAAEIEAFATAVARGPRLRCGLICFPAIESNSEARLLEQLVAQFAAAGHRVYDLSPHVRPDGQPFELEEVGTTVYKVSLRARPLTGAPDRLDNGVRDELFSALDALRRREGIGAAMVYAQSPIWRPLLERLRAEFAWSIVEDGGDDHGRLSANRIAALVTAAHATFPLASIVILTYNNLPLNRLCLESVYAHTEWPNFEVIVVDNASTDGTREYLKEAEAHFPRLRVVLNEANLGFAAGNNIGLRMAQGDFVVLLNNDTVVARGWLSALIRHLVADPTIGLIGPVTNGVWNEAKVSVGYQRLEDMPVWAAEFTRRHDGDVFEIPMLAMFCMAMRRATFADIGLLDEQFGMGMFEDDDYALRARERGYRVLCAADAFVHHFGGAAFKKLMDSDAYQRLFSVNRQRYEAKWKIGWTPHRGAL